MGDVGHEDEGMVECSVCTLPGDPESMTWDADFHGEGKGVWFCQHCADELGSYWPRVRAKDRSPDRS